MALKKIWHLEIWLLIAMAVILMLSITRHTEHAPHWSLWIAAGLLAFFMSARPKITGAIIIAIPANSWPTVLTWPSTARFYLPGSWPVSFKPGFMIPAGSACTWPGHLVPWLFSWLFASSCCWWTGAKTLLR